MWWKKGTSGAIGRGSGETRGGASGDIGEQEGWGGRRGINIRQVLQDTHSARINEEERQRVRNVLGVPSPKIGEMGTKTGILPQITDHVGFYCCLCETSFGDDDNVMVDDKWMYCPICFMF